MKITLAVLVCLLLSICVNGQEVNDVPEKQQVSRISLAKMNADGTFDEDLTVFGVSDIPIFCFIDLELGTSAGLKMELIAVRAAGLRSNSKVIVVNYRTKEGETSVTFSGRPHGKWAVGEYRADILLDGKSAGSVSFKIAAGNK